MDTRLTVLKEDITKMQVDAIVNAANSSLLGGGGVDGAIHRAGGPAILEECKQIREKQGKCPTGEAVITTAGNLPCRKVIHTVGPVWGQQVALESDQLLASCYTNSLLLAYENDCKSIAFPNISTGAYGFPHERAAKVAVKAVQGFLKENDKKPKEIVFVCFGEENYQLYSQLLNIDR